MYHWDKLTQTERTDLITEQLVHEEEMINQILDEDSYAMKDAKVQSVLEELMAPMISGLQAMVDHYLSEGDDRERARLPEWIEPVVYIGISRTAYVFTSALLKLFLDPRVTHVRKEGSDLGDDEATLQYFARMVSEDIFEMLHFFDARDKNPEFYREQSKYFRNWEPRRRRAFAKKVSNLKTWNFKKKMKVGMALLQTAKQQNLCQFTMRYRQDRKKKYDRITFVHLSDDVKEMMEQSAADLMAYLCPTRFPLVCRPLDLTEDEQGGFRSEDLRRRSKVVTGTTVKIITPQGEDEVASDLLDQSGSLGAAEEEGYVSGRVAPPERHSTTSRETINNLQRIEWRVNDRVLGLMEDFHNADNPVGRVPRKTNEREEIGRWADDATPQEIAQHKARLSQVYTEWHRNETSRLQFYTLTNAARSLKGRVLWHAYNADFRGRFYSDSAYLNPQGDDLNKSLIQFATPYKVSKVGIYWLMVGLANEMGYDKASFDGRVKWVQERMDLWKQIDANPHNTVREWEDDSKMKNATFTRVARIFDLMNALRTGYSSMPVNLDGSCNGAQHWAAITRDNAVAEKVNLMDTPVPQDLYQFVADGCTKMCMDEPNPWRNMFLEHFDGAISRKVCKRSVMCDPYGISDHSVRGYVIAEGHLDWVPKETRIAAAKEMGDLICTSKEKQMQFVNHGKRLATLLCGWVVGETNTPFWWYSPNGFQVINHYQKREKMLLSLEIWNKSFERKYQVQSTVKIDTDEPSAEKSAQAMPPNWIHSIDGAHMSFSVNGMIAVGIIQQSVIHDSFGCPAEDVPVMREIIKEKFYEIHLSDQLRGLIDHAEAIVGRELPADHPASDEYQLGDYDIRDVLDSEYAFA